MRILEPADAIVAGGGLAGLVAALELLTAGKSVLLLEKGSSEDLGGLAKEAFGGVTMVGTPQQRRLRIPDSPAVAFEDWLRIAEFEPTDVWPKAWARLYCERSMDLIYDFLVGQGVTFLPVVNWPERGLLTPGNSLPRWHITWGTGSEIIKKVLAALERHPHRDRLRVLCDHEVARLEVEQGRAVGVAGRDLRDGVDFRARAESTLIAAGGICGGDLSTVKKHWNPNWGEPPASLLNGSHRYADGLLHEQVRRAGGMLTHLENQWHYAAGIHHPARRKFQDGLSLLPPRSALWLNARGKRIGPMPLVGYTDTRHLVEAILAEPGQYSWLVMNWKIAIRELAASGGEFMTAFRDKKKFQVLKNFLLGDKSLVRRLIKECPEDVVVAHSLPELAEGMNKRNLGAESVSLPDLKKAIEEYDAQIELGSQYFSDDQLRRILTFRQFRGDRLRICKFQKILAPSALPLIAIRSFILSRKSLGGILTDLESRVLSSAGQPIPGLYAIGEAAGFGGGGIHGKRSLEGTFLGACVLTARLAVQHLAHGTPQRSPPI